MGHLAGLQNGIFDTDVAASASGKGNGAIGTKIIATVLYFQEITRTVTPGTSREEAMNFAVRSRKNRCLFMLLILQMLQQIHLLICSQHQVYSRNGCQFCCSELGIATGDHNEGLQVFANEPVNILPAFLLGRLSHRTGVDDTNIRFLSGFYRLITCLLHLFAQSRTFGKIQFASQGIKQKCRGLYGGLLSHELENNQIFLQEKSGGDKSASVLLYGIEG